MTCPRLLLCIVALLLAGTDSAIGQDSPPVAASDTTAPSDSLWQMDLDPVVVTATRSERAASDVSVPVSVIGQQEIELQGAARMTDLLANQPGLTWREDWPEKRKETIPEIQQMVKAASENGTALVIPARTTAEGRASEYLEGSTIDTARGWRRTRSLRPGCASKSKRASTASRLRRSLRQERCGQPPPPSSAWTCRW